MVASTALLAGTKSQHRGKDHQSENPQNTMKKVPFLLTSPEKSQQEPGNGSSNTDSPTPTGKTIAAILQPKKDSTSVSQTSVQFPFPKEDTLEPRSLMESNSDLSKLIKIQRYYLRSDWTQELHVTRDQLPEFLEGGWQVAPGQGLSPNGSPEGIAIKALTWSEIIDKHRKLSSSKT